MQSLSPKLPQLRWQDSEVHWSRQKLRLLPHEFFRGRRIRRSSVTRSDMVVTINHGNKGVERKNTSATDRLAN